jgi:hypothetical protein
VEENQETTTPEPPSLDKFFRFPSNTYTVQDREIVKVLKKEDHSPTTEDSDLGLTTAEAEESNQTTVEGKYLIDLVNFCRLC